VKFIQYVSFVIGVGIIGVGIAVGGSGAVASAHDGEDHSSMEHTEAKASSTDTKSSSKVYSYTAQSGDAYTQLVRKAVQTYGIKNDKQIGAARIVAIETQASERAGWPELNQGEVVSFDEALIKTWVDAAMKLSDSDVAAWQTYVPYIDFNTNSIGE